MARVAMTWPMMERGECLVDGQRVMLDPTETLLLSTLLAADPHRGLSYDELIEAGWPNPDRQPLGVRDNLKVYISWLRSAGVPIAVEWGRGARIPVEGRCTTAPPACRNPEACRGPCRGCFRLCQRCENLRRNEDQRRYGLTRQQAQMFIYIRRNPGVTFKEIKRDLAGGRTMLQKRLDSLIDKGLVFRGRVPDSPRGWHYVHRVKLKSYRIMAKPASHLPAVVERALKDGRASL